MSQTPWSGTPPTETDWYSQEAGIETPWNQLPSHSGHITSHHDLTGLDADDHLQYLTPDRGDSRYLKLSDAPVPTVVNVKDFGAKGDNSTDDYAALQACLASVKASSLKRTIYVPAGNYRFSQPLLVDFNQFNIIGDGKENSVLLFTGSGAAITPGDGVTYYSRWSISSLTINTSLASANAIGLDLNNVGRSQYNNIRVRSTPALGGGIGVLFTGGSVSQDRSTYYNTFTNCEFFINGIGATSTGYANAQSFYNCIFEGTGIGLKVDGGTTVNNCSGWFFSNTTFSVTNADSIILGNAAGINSSVAYFQFINCRLEPSTSPSNLMLYANTVNTTFVGGTRSGDVVTTNTGVNNSLMFVNAGADGWAIGTTGKEALKIPSISANTGITLGGDVNLYRSAANILSTDDRLRVDSILEVGNALTAGTQITGSTINSTSTGASAYLNLNAKGTSGIRINVLSPGAGGTFIEAAAGKVGFFGTTPVAKQAAIASPTADVNALKTAVDALRAVLAAYGLIS